MLDVMWFLTGIVFLVAMKALNKWIEKKYPKRTWVGLTDEERKNIMVECESTGDWAWELNAAQAIEDKLKEKNT